jgi:hypothetical protein
MSKPRTLRVYQYVTRPYDRVRDVLRKDALEILRAATTSAAQRAAALTATLHVTAGLIDVGVDVRTHVLSVRDDQGVAGLPPATRVELSWEAARAAGLFPSMRCVLSCWALSPTETQLELDGEYVPPLGLVGSALDAAVLHRVAEATVHRLLEDVCEEIQRH